jgi:hypothetical protein
MAGALDPATIDPANELLWKMRFRRLESEAVRDAMLAVSGRLNSTVGGPPVPIEARTDGMVVVAAKKLANPADAGRRSVYLLARRAYNLSFLAVFDQPPIATNCLGRDASAVPLQSLTMLNDEFVAEQSRALAERVEAATGSASERTRIESAFRLVLGRRPSEQESAWCEELLVRQVQRFQSAGSSGQPAAREALVQLCHTLFNTSEFLYAE